MVDAVGGRATSPEPRSHSPATARSIDDFPVPESGSCADTGGHYDPMQSVPEYGDLSHPAKHGLLSEARNSYALDSTLPLYGAYSVLGRSIVIHENDGASRGVRARRSPTGSR